MLFDINQTYIVFDRLVSSFKARDFPYTDALRPQDIVGEGLKKYEPRQQANFWFFCCMYMRGPIDSNQAISKLFEIFEDHGGEGIFDPRDIRSHRSRFIVNALEDAGLTRLLKDVRKFWPQGAQRLSREYFGDCRNIYSGERTFDEVLSLCSYTKETKTRPAVGFMGFQKKMVSMLTYFLRERGLITLDKFPPPVDFHLMRIMINTNVLLFEDGEDPSSFRYESSQPTGYEAVEYYLRETDEDPVVLGDALWLLSGNLCEKSPRCKKPKTFGSSDTALIAGASLAVSKELKKPPGIFPLEELPPYHIDGTSSKIRATCWRCPAGEYCTSGMPSTEYYIRGRMRVVNQVTAQDMKYKERYLMLEEINSSGHPVDQVKSSEQPALFVNLHTQRRPPKEVVV